MSYHDNRFHTACIAILRIVFVFVNNLYCIPMHAILLLVIYPLKLVSEDVYWRIEGIFFRWLLSMVSLWSYSAHYDVVECGDDISKITNERSIFLFNHQSTSDVPLTMAAFSSKNRVLDNLLWIMDKVFLKTNFGLISWGHGDFFISAGKEHREKSLQELKKHLNNFYLPRRRKWIVLFPEGGFLRNRLETSQRFARKNNLRHLKNVSLPRVGALKVILDELSVPDLPDSKKLKYLVDVTIAYPGGDPLDLTTIFGGWRRPCQTIFFYKIYNVSEIPKNEKELTNWLYEKYYQKEKLLQQYYDTSVFPVHFYCKPGTENSCEGGHLETFEKGDSLKEKGSILFNEEESNLSKKESYSLKEKESILFKKESDSLKEKESILFKKESDSLKEKESILFKKESDSLKEKESILFKKESDSLKEKESNLSEKINSLHEKVIEKENSLLKNGKNKYESNSLLDKNLVEMEKDILENGREDILNFSVEVRDNIKNMRINNNKDIKDHFKDTNDNSDCNIINDIIELDENLCDKNFLENNISNSNVNASVLNDNNRDLNNDNKHVNTDNNIDKNKDNIDENLLESTKYLNKIYLNCESSVKSPDSSPVTRKTDSDDCPKDVTNYSTSSSSRIELSSKNGLSLNNELSSKIKLSSENELSSKNSSCKFRDHNYELNVVIHDNFEFILRHLFYISCTIFFLFIVSDFFTSIFNL